jgi:hypothetical protein
VRRILIPAALVIACASSSPKMPTKPSATGSFESDVTFIGKHAKVIVLEHESGGLVAVSPTLQGRVMTSTVSAGGAGLGFVHRAFFDGGKVATAFDNYGGEDRFWLGPEGTKFSLYFAKGAALDFDHWQTPHSFNEGAWDVSEQTKRRIAMRKALHLENHAGNAFDVAVERTIDLIDGTRTKSALGAAVPAGVKWVAFESRNAITNSGKEPWTRDKGLVNVWVLGMYAPSNDASAIIPFDAKGEGPIVRDDYFGKVPSERLTVNEGHLVFRCDGQLRSKIGVSPSRAKSVLGSYSPSAGLLTIVQYDGPRPGVYPSGVWKEDADPWAGDVVNAYNDGPVAPGKPSLGGFYELETLSPGAELAPGATLVHTHRTFHFVGAREALDPLARAVLGVPLP